MRAIDADALKESVLKWLPHDPCGVEENEYPYETDICVSMLMEIEDAPTIEPEPHWIPCKDQLPEVNEMVLAFTVWNDITIAWRIGIDKWFIHEGGANATTEDLSAWMPLPECYREDEG